MEIHNESYGGKENKAEDIEFLDSFPENIIVDPPEESDCVPTMEAKYLKKDNDDGSHNVVKLLPYLSDKVKNWFSTPRGMRQEMVWGFSWDEDQERAEKSDLIARNKYSEIVEPRLIRKNLTEGLMSVSLPYELNEKKPVSIEDVFTHLGLEEKVKVKKDLYFLNRYSKKVPYASFEAQYTTVASNDERSTRDILDAKAKERWVFSPSEVEKKKFDYGGFEHAKAVVISEGVTISDLLVKKDDLDRAILLDIYNKLDINIPESVIDDTVRWEDEQNKERTSENEKEIIRWVSGIKEHKAFMCLPLSTQESIRNSISNFRDFGKCPSTEQIKKLEQEWGQALDLAEKVAQGEILVNWESRVREGGSNQERPLVISENGSFRKHNDIIGRTKGGSGRGKSERVVWEFVTSNEVACKITCGTLKEPWKFTIEKLPTDGLSDEQFSAILERIKSVTQLEVKDIDKEYLINNDLILYRDNHIGRVENNDESEDDDEKDGFGSMSNAFEGLKI